MTESWQKDQNPPIPLPIRSTRPPAGSVPHRSDAVHSCQTPFLQPLDFFAVRTVILFVVLRRSQKVFLADDVSALGQGFG